MVAMLPILLPVLGLGLAARSAATKSASRSSTQLLRACIGSAAFVEALDKTRKIDKKEIKVALLDASYTSPEKARLILFSSARASTKVHSPDEKRQKMISQMADVLFGRRKALDPELMPETEFNPQNDIDLSALEGSEELSGIPPELLQEAMMQSQKSPQGSQSKPPNA